MVVAAKAPRRTKSVHLIVDKLPQIVGARLRVLRKAQNIT